MTHLAIYGMDVCTTSFGKALHWSMTSGVDGVRPHTSLATAADAMMKKSEHRGKSKGKNTANINSNQMNRTRLWDILDEEKKLVHWCGIESHKE